MGKSWERIFQSSYASAIVVLLVSAYVFKQYGFYGKLLRDDSVFIYSGQQLVNGVPPYVSVFQPKTPLWAFVSGFGVFVANHFNFNDVLGVRMIFYVISCITVVSIYLLGSTLFGSRQTGLLAAFIFIGFWGFGKLAASGPRAKTLMVFFQTMALLFTTRKEWFWAGVSGACAFLTWQPAIIYPFVTIFLSFMQSKGNRVRNSFYAITGSLIPVALILIYFAYVGALDRFINDAFLFPLYYLDHGSATILQRLLRPVDVIYKGYAFSANYIFLGFFMMLLLYVWRIRTYPTSVRKAVRLFLSEDLYAAFLLSFVAPIIWSIIDFQGYPDFYVFLPYFAISFSWMLWLALQSFNLVVETGPNLQQLAFWTICIVLVITAARGYRVTSNNQLIDQIRWAQDIEAQYLVNNKRLLSIGRPEVLVLLHRTNPNRHIVINSGEHKLIEQNTPGGLTGWLNEQIDLTSPPIVILGPASPREVRRSIIIWLKRHNFKRDRIGSWDVYVYENQ